MVFEQNEFSRSVLGGILTGVPRVRNYNNLKLNGIAENLALEDVQAPHLPVELGA